VFHKNCPFRWNDGRTNTDRSDLVSKFRPTHRSGTFCVENDRRMGGGRLIRGIGNEIGRRIGKMEIMLEKWMLA
jgi:hypothetical protein